MNKVPLPVEGFQDANLHAPLLLRDANLSDLAAYAPMLLRSIFADAMGKPTSSEPRVLIFTASNGVTALSWPDDISYFALKLDLKTLESTLSQLGVAENLTVPFSLRRLDERLERYASEMENGLDALEMARRLVFSGF